MRVKRVDKFKKKRHERKRKILIFGFLLPAASVLIGYILTSTVILPVMK